MNELNSTLENMGALQLLLALLFLASYATLLGGFVEGTAQAAAGGLAALTAAAFTALTTPWVHGLLLTVFVVIGMGLFIVAAWVVTTLAGRARGGVPANSQLLTAYPTQMLEEDEAEQRALLALQQSQSLPAGLDAARPGPEVTAAQRA